MSVDIEAGGALATAGLAAKAIDGEGGAADAHGGGDCANCHARLVGAYCHACGQSAHVHRSILHMLEEGLHGVLHFDSKMWRTLPLLVGRPGLLTRRYIDGQRVRYVSPLALFLFTIFLMFFVVSFVAGGKPSTVSASPEQTRAARAELVAELEIANAEVAKQSAALAAANDDDERTDVAAELEAAKSQQRIAQSVLSVFDKARAAPGDSHRTTVVTGEDLTAMTGLDFGNSKVNGVVERLTKNPDLMLYKLKNTAYKFSFMLIPISLPFLWLMFFWKPDVTAYDHMVFSMYSLSFMSLFFIVLALMGLSDFTSRFVGYLLWFAPLHMFMHLKETYRLKFSSALWRTVALLVSAGTVFVLFMSMVVALTAM